MAIVTSDLIRPAWDEAATSVKRTCIRDPHVNPALRIGLMLSSRKSKRRTNPIARALRTPTFRQKKIRPKKGRGSYSRVKRSETPLSFDVSISLYPTQLVSDQAKNFECLVYQLFLCLGCWRCRFPCMAGVEALKVLGVFHERRHVVDANGIP